MATYILGDGITAKMLAKLLGINELYVPKRKYDSKSSLLSPVLTLKLDAMTIEEYNFILSVFDLTDCYVQNTVGFKYKGKIYDYPTSDMVSDYLKSMNRSKPAGFKFETSYVAIDIVKMIEKNCQHLTYLPETSLPSEHAKLLITNKQINTKAKKRYEYIKLETNEMHGYTYIYDCDPDSNVKRYYHNITEYIDYVPGSIKIQNYIEPQKIYTSYDFRTDIESTYVGRYASKTRIEQIDVIKFAMKLSKEINK